MSNPGGDEERRWRLTPRERVILAHLARGRNVKAIAWVEVREVTTIRSQVAAVLRKLRVESQLEAVALVNAQLRPDYDEAIETLVASFELQLRGLSTEHIEQGASA